MTPPAHPPVPRELPTRSIAFWLGVYALIGVGSFIVLKDAVVAVMPIWLPAGVGLAVQMRASPRQRPWIALAQFVVEFTLEESMGAYRSLPLHLAYATAEAIEAWLTAVIAERLNEGQPLRLRTLRELRAFFIACALGTMLAGFGAAIVEVMKFPDETYFKAVLTWMQADVVAFVVLTPLVLAALDRVGAEYEGSQVWGVLIAAVLASSVTVLFSQEFEPRSPFVALSFLLFPPFIWAALQYGVVGAATGSLFLSIMVGLLTENHLGPIAALGLGEFPRQLIAQGYVGLLALSALTLGVLRRQQRDTERSLTSARDEARESAERFRSYIDGVPEMIAAVDRDGRFVLANRQWIQTWGQAGRRADIVGRLVEEVDHPSPSDATPVQGLWRRALAGETFATGWSLRRSDGTAADFEMALAPLREPTGRVVGALMSVRDVAHLRAQQDEQARTRRLEMVGRLAGGIAHDFNNIITGIQGYAQLVADTLPEGHPALEDLAEIQKAGDRGASLTRQLLAYARRQVIEPQLVPLRQLLEGLTSLLRRLIGEGVQLRVTAPADLWAVRADPGQLEQVLMNLAVNARDAMPQGGQLEIRCANVVVEPDTIDARDVEPGRYVEVTVTDSGHGMPPEVVERVFEPFFTTKPFGRGTGLGLATVDGIIRQLGGVTSVQSTVGVGTTLRFLLPRDSTLPVVAAADRPVLSTNAHGAEHVILVEDDPALRSLSQRTLQHHGYTVDVFEDGASAVAMSDERLRRAALLVADVGLPGVNGAQVAAELVARSPRLRVLFVSGYAEEVLLHHGVTQQGIDFLPKPYSTEQFLQRVRRALDASAAP